MKIHQISRNNAVLLYGLLFGYVLSFVFDGPVYYGMIAATGKTCSDQSLLAMTCHLAGLLAAGAFIKNGPHAQKIMRIMLIVCACTTPFFVLNNQVIASAVIIVVAFASGTAVACWGAFYFSCFEDNNRLEGMANSLILANILMMITGLVATYISALAGFVLSLSYLIIAIVVLHRNKFERNEKYEADLKDVNLRVTTFLFFAFIVVITINSGLMYGVFNTEYLAFEKLTAWYWVLPYLVALFIMKKLSFRKSSNLYIYFAIVMMIAGFILNMLLEIKPASYIIIDSLLLGAAGILDLFWASIVGSSFKYIRNPVRMLSVGWSANVVGVLIGGVFSRFILAKNLSTESVALIALVVICASLMILPEMLRRLSLLFVNNLYLRRHKEMPEEKQIEAVERLPRLQELTNAEQRVLQQILLGKSNKAIAEELSISENTVKTHVRNILTKYEVPSRIELISLLLRQ